MGESLDRAKSKLSVSVYLIVWGFLIHLMHLFFGNSVSSQVVSPNLLHNLFNCTLQQAGLGVVKRR